MPFSRTPSLCSLAALFALPAFAASHPEVLVVYNSTSSDSLAVANHYISQRNIPAANLCAITPPSTTSLSLPNYITYVKTPIQNCLNTLGQKNILYIVMSYMTPYEITTGPFGLSAIDSYLADIWDKYVSQPFLGVPNLTQPYYADSQSQGNVYSPFQTFAAWRANARNPLIYSVWRLDAPSAAIASALVDKAIAAETQGGPVGQACLDETFDATIFPDQGTGTGNWDLYKASQFLSSAGLTVLLDSLQSEFGTPPSPNCPNTAYYSGWYSLDNYNDAFTWNTGAVGWHLDSGSATNPRSGPDWAPNALLRGITVTSGSVTEPYLQGLVRPGGTFRNLLEGASVGDAFLRNTRWLKWQILYIGDPLYKPFGAGLPPFSPLQPVNSFMISPQEIVGGTNSTGTITISAPAPPSGTTFNLTAQSGVTIPATATIPSGSTKVSFPITTAVVSGSQSPIITATAGALTLQNTILTDPLLGGFAASASSTMAGYPVTVEVLLNGRAPVGGATIMLATDNPAITVPSSVTVPAGSTAAAFTATSVPVTSTATGNIIGTYAGFTSRFPISVVPALASMAASPSTINAGGTTVISVNLSLPVPAGFTANVQLQSSDPVALPVPSTLTFTPAGGTYNNFFATASPSAPGETVTVTATFGGSTAMTTVTISPPLTLAGPSTCRQGQVCNYAASFGTPPYTYSLVSGSVGSISSSSGVYTAPSHITPKQVINGCQAFPNNSIFNTRIDNLPLHPNNTVWMSNITAGANVFQPGQRISGSTVLSSDPAVPMNFVHTPPANANFIFQAFPDRVSQAGAAFTAPGFMPNVDDHYMTTYRDTCQQQENYQYYQAGAYGAFPVSNSAAGLQFSLEGHQLPGWGTDAAGLPFAPLTVHQDELLAAANGNLDAIQHAARLTLAKTSIATGKLIWPAQALWDGVSQNNFCQGPNTQNSVWTINGNGTTTLTTTTANQFRPAWPAGMTITIDNVNYTIVSVASDGLSMVVSANIGSGSHSMTTPDTNCPPYGTRFRLKANFQWPTYLPNCDIRCQNVVQAVIRQQQRYGVILADIGTAWGFDADGGFTTGSIETAAEQLSCNVANCQFDGLIGNASNYEIVDESSLQTSQTQGTPALNWLEAKLGNPYVTPQDGAVVKVTDAASSTAYYSVALQGVGLGVNHPNEVVMAGASPFQIPVWVTGTSNSAYTCSLFPSGGAYGTISSGCLYTPPTTGAVSTLTNATVTITAGADSAVTKNVYIQVVPVASDGSIRISLGKTGPVASYTDNSGSVWWNDMTDGLPINLFPDGNSVSGPIYEPIFTDYPGSSYFATAPLVYQSTWFAAYNDLHFRIHVPNGRMTGTLLPINSGAPSVDVAAFSFDCNGTAVLGQTDLYTYTGGTYISRPLTCSQTVSDGLLHMVMRIQGVAYGPHTFCSGSCYIPSYQGAANIVAGLMVNPS